MCYNFFIVFKTWLPVALSVLNLFIHVTINNTDCCDVNSNVRSLEDDSESTVIIILSIVLD